MSAGRCDGYSGRAGMRQRGGTSGRVDELDKEDAVARAVAGNGEQLGQTVEARAAGKVVGQRVGADFAQVGYLDMARGRAGSARPP